VTWKPPFVTTAVRAEFLPQEHPDRAKLEAIVASIADRRERP
jgi:hypothetical protein